MSAPLSVTQDRIHCYLKKHSRGLFYLFLLFLVLWVYKDYVFGQRVFLSKYEAMDSYDQYYPSLLALARDIVSSHITPHVDFTSGLGTEVNIFIPLIQNLPAYFGETFVAYMLGICQIMKVYFSGVFFYEYVRAMGKGSYIAALSCMGYAFCGQMMLRQWWSFYPVEVLLVAIWLWSFEQAFTQNDKKWLPLCTCIFYLNCSLYYIFLYSLIFLTYGLLRSIVTNKLSIRWFALYSLFIICFAITAYGITGIPKELVNVLTSERFTVGVTNAVAESEKSNFLIKALFTEQRAYVTAFFRTISTNIIQGKMNTIWWSGQGVIDDATFYCGLFTILLLPVCCAICNKREKICYAMGFILAGLYFCIQPLRIMINGFGDDGFRLSSFWITVFILYIVAQKAERLFDNPDNKHFITLALGGIIIIAGAKWNGAQHRTELNITALFVSLFLIVIYLFLLFTYVQLASWRVPIKYLLFLLAIVEIFGIGGKCVTDMDTLSYEEYSARTGYNDFTNEVLDYLNKSEDQMDYRIDKQYMSFRFCDSMAQNYFGTAWYIGGLGGNQNIRSFYESMALPTVQDYTGIRYRQAYGTSAYNEVNEILGVKYILSGNGKLINYGYKKVYEEEGISLWENLYTLPMGYIYHSYIPFDKFQTLKEEDRRKILLQSCVLEENAIRDVQGIIPAINSVTAVSDKLSSFYNRYRADFMITDKTCLVQSMSENDVLVLNVSFDLESPEYRARIMYSNDSGQLAGYRIRIDNSDTEYIYEINAPNVNEVYFFDEYNEKIAFNLNEGYLIPQEEYYREYREQIGMLQKDGVNITDFSGSYIAGKVNTDEDGICFFSIPNSSWEIYVDGNHVDKFVTNIGFMGCFVSSGEHKVELRFENRTAWIDMFGKVFLIILSIIWIIGLMVMSCLKSRKKYNKAFKRSY